MYTFERNRNYRPRLLLAYVDSAHAVHVGRHFRRLGWEVHMVASAGEAYRLVPELKPRVIVLDTELPDESGWLACAKMTLDNPETRIVLLAAERSAQDERRLAEIQAESLVTRDDRVEHLVETILGSRMAEAV